MSKSILPAVLAVALVAGLVSVGVAGAATRTVALKNIAFSPKSLKVSRGTKVTFAFRDGSTRARSPTRSHGLRHTGMSARCILE